MPVTKDLKPSEFELTIICPVGACFVQHTYAYDRGVLELPAADRKDVKERMVAMAKAAHEEGKHGR